MANTSPENPARPARHPLTPPTVGLWLVAAVLVGTYVYLNVITLRGATLTDFHVYHEALLRAARGEPIYDLDAPMPFLYPPFYLILLRPLGGLSEPAAMAVWLYLQNALFLVSIVSLLAVFRTFDVRLTALSIILFAGFSPVMLNNLYGQANLLYLALLGVFVLGYVRAAADGGKSVLWDLVAAAALSLAISIRVLPVALLVMAGIQRRSRVVLMTLVCVAVEAAAAGLLVGFGTQWHYFTSYIFHLRGHENMREISLLALFDRIAPARLALALYVLAVAAGLGLFVARVFPAMRNAVHAPALHVAFVLSSMVLFAPILEYHHYVLLLAPFVLVLGELYRRGRCPSVGLLPVFLSWAIISAANQLSHYGFGAVAFLALAGAAGIWIYTVHLIANAHGGHLP